MQAPTYNRDRANARRSVFAVLLAAIALTACGGGGGTGKPPSPGAAAAGREGAVVAHAGDDAIASGGQPTTAPRGRVVLVDVAGAVRRPGVYELRAGSRLHEALAAAGGVRAGADLSGINRASEVVDGQQVLVPVRGSASSAAAPGQRVGAELGARVSINSADAEALDALPGIGPVTAQKIVDDRSANGPFASVDELDRVPGIGAATIDELRGAATT